MNKELTMVEERFLPALIEDDQTDYTLRESAGSCWITVNNISVYIRRTDEGVVVDLYKLDNEAEEAIASTYAFFAEAEPEE